MSFLNSICSWFVAVHEWFSTFPTWVEVLGWIVIVLLSLTAIVLAVGGVMYVWRLHAPGGRLYPASGCFLLSFVLGGMAGFWRCCYGWLKEAMQETMMRKGFLIPEVPDASRETELLWVFFVFIVVLLSVVVSRKTRDMPIAKKLSFFAYGLGMSSLVYWLSYRFSVCTGPVAALLGLVLFVVWFFNFHVRGPVAVVVLPVIGFSYFAGLCSGVVFAVNYIISDIFLSHPLVDYDLMLKIIAGICIVVLAAAAVVGARSVIRHDSKWKLVLVPYGMLVSSLFFGGAALFGAFIVTVVAIILIVGFVLMLFFGTDGKEWKLSDGTRVSRTSLFTGLLTGGDWMSSSGKFYKDSGNGTVTEM